MLRCTTKPWKSSKWYVLRKEHIDTKIGLSPETQPNTYFYKGIEAGQQRRDFLRNILGQLGIYSQEIG